MSPPTTDDLKARVKAYFEEHDGEEITPDVVAEVMGADLIAAIAACEELVAEGKLA